LSEDKDTVISAEYLFVKKNKSLKKVLIEDIIYIEVEELILLPRRKNLLS
jgi:hypothetical protein